MQLPHVSLWLIFALRDKTTPRNENAASASIPLPSDASRYAAARGMTTAQVVMAVSADHRAIAGDPAYGCGIATPRTLAPLTKSLRLGML